MELLVLAGLIVLNGLFAMSEVALLTARRSRLATLARRGDGLAAAALKLGEEPTRFLSTIQIGITCIGLLSGIVGEAVLAAPLAAWFQSLGLEQTASAFAATAVVVVMVTYVSIVIGEIVPKRLAQRSAENVARLAAWPMRALALVSAPFVHLLAASTDAILKPLLKVFGIREEEFGAHVLSLEELRTIVLESSNILPKKHATILLNLVDLEATKVDDVMVPRNQIEAIDIEAPLEDIVQQLATAHHRRVLVYRHQLDEIVGALRVRHALNLSQQGELTRERLSELVREPYFVPSGTALFSQLQNFQEQQERMSLVVDEYGELLGLVNIEDILEEIIGEFTTRSPLTGGGFARQPDGSYLVEGGTLLRELNRKLALRFPLQGPRTLNGLILEHLRDIPEPGTSLKVAGCHIEILQTQDRVVRMVRIFPESVARAGAPDS